MAGAWYELTYTNATTATFEAPSDLAGMLLARCAAGTTKPDWSIKTDGPGRIYNQTSDIAVKVGQTSYPCSDWTEYNPE